MTSILHVFPNRTTDDVTFTYDYDPSGRDASLSLSNGAYAYVPTAATTSYATPNALNQYPAVNGYTYSWWPEGGLEQTDTVLARYNELGKLTNPSPTVVPGVVDPNNWEFVGIDALDHAYFHEAQTVSGQPYPFIYHWTDGLRPETILESQYQYQSGQSPVFQGNRRYVLGPDPDERWAFLDFNGTITYPHTDREGSLIALADGGEASSITTYDAYGQSTAAATDVGPGDASYLYRYTGQRLDPTTGLYDYKARDYSPKLGRFLQPDPKGLDVGPNLYEYVGNDPLGAGDPSGECPIAFCGVGGSISPNPDGGSPDIEGDIAAEICQINDGSGPDSPTAGSSSIGSSNSAGALSVAALSGSLTPISNPSFGGFLNGAVRLSDDALEIASDASDMVSIGFAGEARVRQAILAKGYQIAGEQVYIRTRDGGLRIVEFVITDGRGGYAAIEAKANTSTRTPSQITKDNFIAAFGGGWCREISQTRL